MTTTPSSDGPRRSSSSSLALTMTATRRGNQVSASAIERLPTVATLRRSGVVKDLPVSELIGSTQQNPR
jgi:hypothetical protein